MSDKIIENNQVTVIGTVVSEFTYSHYIQPRGVRGGILYGRYPCQKAEQFK